MKRGHLVRHLRAEGCSLWREGARHSLWRNPATGAEQAVPRRREIDDILARLICRKLGVREP